MEKNLEIFEKKEFGLIKVEMVDGNVIFNLGDVSKILDLDPHDVKKRLTKSGIYDRIEMDENGLYVPSSYISEPNFYRCVMQSKKPEAEKFQDWVVEEVLPSIRKHGAYMTKEKLVEIYSDPREMAKLFTELADERDLRIATQKELEVAKPKAEYYDKILDSKYMLTATNVAKSLDMTAQCLNKILLKLGVTMHLSKNKENPAYGLTYRYNNEGYGNVKDIPVYGKDGSLKFNAKCLVYTEKGKEMICKLLLDKGLIKTNEDGSVTTNRDKISEFLKEKEDED
jgi:prophage antirepressor-like protein|nr:MAG TPA: repressor domain protein [Bacteriophage sp.]